MCDFTSAYPPAPSNFQKPWLSLSLKKHTNSTWFWRWQWQPTPVLLPGKSHGQRNLVGCSPWGCEVRHNWVTSLSLFTFMHQRRKWQPTPVFLPGESQGWGRLMGCRLWDRRVGHDWSDLAAAAAPDLINVTTVEHQEPTASPTIKLYKNSSYSHIKLRNLDNFTTA